MGQPLTTTSTTNVHALAVYGCLGFVGGYFTFDHAHPALSNLLGDYMAFVLMGFVMLSGVGAFIACLLAGKHKDPSAGLMGEIVTLIPLTLILIALLWAFFKEYGMAEAPTTIGFTLTFLTGCGGRLIQAAVEHYQLKKARRSSHGETTEVTAKPRES